MEKRTKKINVAHFIVEKANAIIGSAVKTGSYTVP